jgi:hypothetical protein
VVRTRTKEDTQHILRKTLNWRPVKGRPRGRSRIRWEDQIHEDIRRIGIEDWRIKIQDRKNWEKKYTSSQGARQNLTITREKNKAE